MERAYWWRSIIAFARLSVVSLTLSLTACSGGGGGSGGTTPTFPPGFALRGTFYVNYTDRNGIGNTVIARYGLGSGKI